MVTTQNCMDEFSSQQMVLLTTQSSYQRQTRWVIPVSFAELRAVLLSDLFCRLSLNKVGEVYCIQTQPLSISELFASTTSLSPNCPA